MFTESFLGELADAVATRVIARMTAQNGAKIEPRYLTVDEAATYTGYTPDALRFYIREQRFPVSRNGSGQNASIRIDRRELDRWMERNKG